MELHYETVCIVDTDVGSDAVKGFIEKATTLVEGQGGKDIVVDEWGRRRLAYPIRKKNEGHYILFTYTAGPLASREFERMCRIDEGVMRYQSVRLDARAEAAVAKPESAPAEAAAASVAAEAPQETAAAEAPAEGGDNE